MLKFSLIRKCTKTHNLEVKELTTSKAQCIPETDKGGFVFSNIRICCVVLVEQQLIRLENLPTPQKMLVPYFPLRGP